jgi:hypothetical protein
MKISKTSPIPPFFVLQCVAQSWSICQLLFVHATTGLPSCGRKSSNLGFGCQRFVVGFCLRDQSPIPTTLAHALLCSSKNSDLGDTLV